MDNDERRKNKTLRERIGWYEVLLPIFIVIVLILIYVISRLT